MLAKFSALVFGVSLSAAAHADPNVGGLHHVFTEVKGKAIAHPLDYPQDGIGTTTYLKKVCRALGHDELVSWEAQKAQYYDVDSKEWVEIYDTPRIYKSVTCAVWVR